MENDKQKMRQAQKRSEQSHSCAGATLRYRGLNEDRRGNWGRAATGVLMDTWMDGSERKGRKAKEPPCVQLANMASSIHSEVRDIFKLAASGQHC